ncbi:hypothetical protein Peur_067536 [Populus x canadensis]
MPPKEKPKEDYTLEATSSNIDRLQGGRLETMVKDMKSFNLGDIPTWFPPDVPLAPRWYRLEDRSGVKVAGELPLTVWMGNQDDDAFPVAWHSDAAADLAPTDKNRKPEAYAKAILGNFVLRTTVSKDKSLNPTWDEEKRLLTGPIGSQSINFESCVVECEEKKEVKFACGLHLRIFLDGVRLVFEEPTYYSRKVVESPMLMIAQRNTGRSGISAPKWNEEMGGDKNGGMKDPGLGKDSAVYSRDVL